MNISDSSDGEEASQSQRRSRAKVKARPKCKKPQFQESASSPEESTSQTQSGDLTEIELKRLASLLANYFLVADCKKVPIKRSELGKLIPKEYSRRIGKIIDVASNKLEEGFGYKIIELEKKGVFILANTLDLADLHQVLKFKIQGREHAVSTLRACILIVILMSDGIVQDSTLDEFVQNFTDDDKENHPLLGNVQKLIYQDFVRQGYLDVTHHKDVDVPFKDVRWGPRAYLELNQKEAIKWVTKVYGDDVKPEMWVDQWKKAMDAEALNEVIVIDTTDTASSA